VFRVDQASGPLSGIRVLQIASLAPGPFAACMLADMGADVVRVDRLEGAPALSSPLLGRGQRSIAVDLKHPEGRDTVLQLVESADALIEGFRPGVMEKLGLGPESCLSRKPTLVYGRMTGFGQDGPLARSAGHDINYISLSGTLSRIGRAGQPPTPPLNLVGDFGGGGMLLAFGILCGLIEAGRSGKGQVVDAAMVDGSALLMLPFFGGRLEPSARGTNLLDSGAPFYDAYETSDGRWVSVGAIEPQFYAELVAGLGLDPDTLPPQMDTSSWPAMKRRIADAFRSKTRDEWCRVFDGSDACFAPVLELDEVAEHPHNSARAAFVTVDETVQPAPAPRFSATPGSIRTRPPRSGEHTEQVLAEWAGIGSDRLGALRSARAIN
jgi:alpha-methylacyl-CoA racemase